MRDKLETVLDEFVRPFLQGHGGGMEVLSVEDGVLRFKLTGQCSGCPAADLTTEDLIREEIGARVPGIRQIVLVREADQALIDQARDILKQRHE